METALLTIVGVLIAAMFGANQWQLARLHDRLDALVDRVSRVEVAVAELSAKLDAHLAHHPT